MSFRPAGYSSDEDDDEYNNFSFHGEIKSEKERQQEIAAEVYNKRRESENTAKHRFYSAVIRGNISQIKEEINNGFDVNSEVSADWTGLFLSATQGNPLVVEELLKNGADVTLTRGIYIIGHVQEKLTNRNFEILSPNRSTPYPSYLALIDYADGFTPLIAICNCPESSVTANDTLSIVRLLLEYAVDVKANDRKRRTAFMFACSQGFIEVVKLLFPLSDLEAQDNQGWTALFYAANENKDDVVNYLIENGADIEHLDVRNNDVKYYALLNDYDLILNLLPKSDFDISPDDFANSAYDYESAFELLLDGERPDLKPDISSLLYGMKCQNFIPMFNKNTVDLFSFLTLNDESLKELGVLMSFQRNRILQGLYNFHRHSWKKTSLPIVPIHETFTTHDIFVAITNAIKHLIILEATIKYLKQNLNFAETNVEKELVAVKTMMALRKINRIKIIVRLLHAKAVQYDSICQGSTDLITNKRSFRKNLLNKKLAIGLTGITVFFLFRCIKSRLY